jgi:hypothetical protein
MRFRAGPQASRNGTLFAGRSKAKASLGRAVAIKLEQVVVINRCAQPWHRNIEPGRSRASRNALSRAGPAQYAGDLE